MAKVAVFGGVTVEFTFVVDQWPERGKSVQGQVSKNLGSKGFFQALATTRMNAETVLISAVGDDSYGREALDKLKEHHIEPCVELVRPNQVTGFSTDIAGLIYDKSGQSCTIGCRGATDQMSEKFVTEQVRAALMEVDAVLVTFDASPAQAERVVQIARELKKPVVVNASPPADASFAMLKEVRYLVATAKEARDWLRMKGVRPAEEIEKDSDEEVAALLLGEGPECVVLILDNPQGCLVVNANGGRPRARRYATYRASQQAAVGERSLFCAGLVVAATEAHLQNGESSREERSKLSKEDASKQEEAIIAFASAARCRAEGIGGHAEALPYRTAIDSVVLTDPPLTYEEVSIPRGPVPPRGRAVPPPPVPRRGAEDAERVLGEHPDKPKL